MPSESPNPSNVPHQPRLLRLSSCLIECCDCFSLAVSRPHSIIDNLILDKTSLHANYICGFFLVRDSVLKLRQFAELFRIGDRMKKNFQLMFFTIDFSSLGGSYKVTLGATCKEILNNMLVVFLLQPIFIIQKGKLYKYFSYLVTCLSCMQIFSKFS